MKVAFVGGRGLESHYGGVENAIRELATRLAGYPDLDVDVYGRGQHLGFNTRLTEPSLTAVEAPRWLSTFRGNGLLATANCLYALLARRPQVLLLFASGPCILTIFARLLRVRVIAALRGIDSQRSKWRSLASTVLRLGEFSATHIAHRCTVNSLEMYHYFRGNARHLRYIPNGASAANSGDDTVLERLHLQPEHYLLFAARLDPDKRLHLLLQAYDLLPFDCRLPLIIAGGECNCPEYRQHLENLAVGNVRFLGHVGPEILDPLMRNCALFVLPSALEGMSNSLLTAMQCGRCVLCSDIRANRDVVQNETGALFRADDLDSLTAALTACCGNPQLRLERGRRMQAIAQHKFHWDTTAAAYYALITRKEAPMSDESASVSVVITAYNRPDYLRTAIASVLEQTRPVSEIIVVDDCSPKDLQPTIALFDFPIRYLRLPRNSGANHARNEGVRLARNPYVAFLDDDDIWLPDKLQFQLPELEQTVACIGGYEYLDTGKPCIRNVDIINGDMLKQGNSFCGMSGLICERRWLLENPFDETLGNGQDWDIYIRLTSFASIHYVPRALYRYRRGNHDSITTRVKTLAPTDMRKRLAVAYKHRIWLGEYYFRRRVANTILGYIGHRQQPWKLVLMALHESGLLATTQVLSEKFGHFMKRGGRITSH